MSKQHVDLVLAHFCIVFQVEVFADIHLNMAVTNTIASVFVRPERIQSSITEPPSLLEVRDSTTFFKALNVPLEHVSAKYRFQLDETPILTDSPMLKSYPSINHAPMSRKGASIWKLLPLFVGDGIYVGAKLSVSEGRVRELYR